MINYVKSYFPEILFSNYGRTIIINDFMNDHLEEQNQRGQTELKVASLQTGQVLQCLFDFVTMSHKVYQAGLKLLPALAF